MHLFKNTFFLFVLFLQKIFPRKGMPVLFFHSMDESGSPLSISRDKFLKFAEYLREHGYGTHTLFTFDDGYRNNIAAIKILRDFGFRTLVFIATAYIGKKNTFCRKEFPEFEMLNANEIRELAHQRVEFGAHGHTHRNLPQLSHGEIALEIKESKRTLEEITGNKIHYFCYPRGKYNDVVLTELKRQGFLGAFTSQTGIVSKSSRPYLLRRVPLNDKVTTIQFKALLSPWYGFFKNIAK